MVDAFTLVGALIFTLTRSPKRIAVPQEALIGIVYVVGGRRVDRAPQKSPGSNEELTDVGR